MRPIESKVFSHMDEATPEGGKVTPKEVRTSPGYPVRRFRDLVRLVASVGYRNRQFNLLFRGQGTDYKSKRGQHESLLYPSIHRPNPLPPVRLLERFERFQDARRVLVKQRSDLGEDPGLYRHWEYQASLLQHYELRLTPLLDVTSSLRVACSFAFAYGDRGEGFVYVLGMPHPHGSLSHFVDDDIVLVRLQNVCPPEALRPHYQEGFLIGRMTAVDQRKSPHDNAANRMLAKYKLTNLDGSFWDEHFAPIPREALLPTNDPFKEKLLELVGPAPAE
jgi:hypothetical protein